MEFDAPALSFRDSVYMHGNKPAIKMECQRKTLADTGMRRIEIWIYTIGLVILTVAACANGGDEDVGGGEALPEDYLRVENNPPISYTYQIINTFPHDRQAFTQGLVFENGVFYESTGLNGRSSLREIDPATGNVLKIEALADRYFGEGIAVFEDRIIQLTWKSQTGFVYDRNTFKIIRQFEYTGEGWGMTHDGKRLIMSDGTSGLRFLDPETLEQTGRVDVYDDKGPVARLNELEFIQGEVFANVWQTDRIARINPETGRVAGWIDLTGLLAPEERQNADVLNGIAYDSENGRLFVTGKLWPKLFEIRLSKAE